MRRWWFVAVAVVTVAVVAVVLLVHRSTNTPGTAIAATTRGKATAAVGAAATGSIPVGAAAACRQLVSGTAVQQRNALTPELASALPSGELFPPNTHLVLDSTSWHATGPYANVVGTLSVVGKQDQEVEIGLVHREGRWLVTFEEALP